MGSPVSPMITNIYMKHFEGVAIRTVENPPKLGKKFVDYTFVKQDFLLELELKLYLCSFTFMKK